MKANARKFAAILAALAIVVYGALVAQRGNGFDGPKYLPCHEDESCWDCRSMGNHVCGDRTYRMDIGDALVITR